MQFLKKHYEKILLGIVLAGLIGVLVFMLFYIAADKQAMADNENSLINAPVKPLPDLDLTTNSAAMTRLQSAYVLDFETGNKVFNPFDWQKKPDGQMAKKITNIARVAVVTNITPLYLILSLDSITTNELGSRYVIGVERQAAPTASKRRRQQRYVSLGEKPNDTFALLEVKGPPGNPEALQIKLLDSGESVTVTREKPFRRVDDYMADFRYDPEKKTFRARRSGDKVSFGGTDYVVFEVNQNELILSDQSNQKKTSLPFTP
jgi:hypothetical protein